MAWPQSWKDRLLSVQVFERAAVVCGSWTRFTLCVQYSYLTLGRKIGDNGSLLARKSDRYRIAVVMPVSWLTESVLTFDEIGPGLDLKARYHFVVGSQQRQI
jgi:hypothetical protein